MKPVSTARFTVRKSPSSACPLRWMAAYGLGLGMIGVALTAGACRAQDLRNLRLEVRPRLMATVARTEQAGVFHTMRDGAVMYGAETMAGDTNGPTGYVPPQCMGARRC